MATGIPNSKSFDGCMALLAEAIRRAERSIIAMERDLADFDRRNAAVFARMSVGRAAAAAAANGQAEVWRARSSWVVTRAHADSPQTPRGEGRRPRRHDPAGRLGTRATPRIRAAHERSWGISAVATRGGRREG
jgi:hypothetical protein